MANKNTMTNQLESILDDIIQGEDSDDKQIVMIDEETIQINIQTYNLLVNYREGFDLDGFKHRYQTFFEKFDFIVGDWGHDQLRLRGFYQLGKRKVPRDQQIDFLDDYIKEYCNFGAAYFVLGKVEAVGKFNQLVKKESKSKREPKKQVKAKPKATNVSTPANDSSENSFNKNPKKPNRKRNFKKNSNQSRNKTQKVTEKISENKANDKKFVIKKVQQKQ